MGSNSIRNLSPDAYTKFVLTAIALLLGAMALQPFAYPRSALAAADYSYLFLEPGTTTLRRPDGLQQVEGKVVIDMRSGDVWGFPTMSTTPYPVDTSKSEPPISQPMYLGKFDFAAIKPK